MEPLSFNIDVAAIIGLLIFFIQPLVAPDGVF